jgi:hypothetical protein
MTLRAGLVTGFAPGLGSHSVKLNEFMINEKIPEIGRAGLAGGVSGLVWIWLRLDDRAVEKTAVRMACAREPAVE